MDEKFVLKKTLGGGFYNTRMRGRSRNQWVNAVRENYNSKGFQPNG